ncbi:erythromycin esterase family protein [Nonomuraea longispora]|uniref:Erythromycin esterase family protein n=1 Tax=Nonomuraea longispora TaxID=1848320 RepID=A0A4R4NMH8_9ACTN|nr:erythromycin esterase family protein [Nonomuraea longispora]TDC10668.1 erythromycin esterase family protein [Nonomuraea longispora]
MSSHSSTGRPAHPLAQHVSVLNTLDPDEPRLDDLDPLRAVVEGARVVAIGEGAHFVREFALARARLLRYLLERCGFTTVAVEMGAGEAAAVNPWLAGEGDEGDLSGVAGLHTINLFGELLRWLRRYNRGGSRPVEIVGIDLPNTLTLRPDLDPVADYLRVVDEGISGMVAGVLRTAGAITGASAAASAPRWADLDAAGQESLTAGLARLSLRMRALEPLYVARSDQHSYDVARRHLEAACHTDYMLRAMNTLFSGTGLPDDTSVRDHYMATCLQWHLDRLDPDTRVVMVAHNNHIQKTLVTYDGYPTALPMGHHLARGLGGHYRAVGLTHTAGEVPDMVWPAEDSPVGFAVASVPLDSPPPGSLERALADAGLATDITLTDLRSADPAVTSLRSMRSQSATMDTPVARSFDAVLCTPTATTDDTATFTA